MYIPETKIEKPIVQLPSNNGNASSIIGKVIRALARAKVPKEVMKKYTDEVFSENYDTIHYDTVLKASMKYVEIK